MDTKWKKILDNYNYPKKPCNGGCYDNCKERYSCPLFQAWKERKSEENND